MLMDTTGHTKKDMIILIISHAWSPIFDRREKKNTDHDHGGQIRYSCLFRNILKQRLFFMYLGYFFVKKVLTTAAITGQSKSRKRRRDFSYFKGRVGWLA